MSVAPLKPPRGGQTGVTLAPAARCACCQGSATARKAKEYAGEEGRSLTGTTGCPQQQHVAALQLWPTGYGRKGKAAHQQRSQRPWALDRHHRWPAAAICCGMAAMPQGQCSDHRRKVSPYAYRQQCSPSGSSSTRPRTTWQHGLGQQSVPAAHPLTALQPGAQPTAEQMPSLCGLLQAW